MKRFQPAAVFLLLVIAPGIAGGMDLGTIGLLPGAVALLCTALVALVLTEASYHDDKKAAPRDEARKAARHKGQKTTPSL